MRGLCWLTDQDNHSVRTSFLHSIIEHGMQRKGEPLPEWLKNYNDNEKKVSCLFGSHLLRKYPGNPVALVEAPKSAIYGTLYFGTPKKTTDPLWLAVYNLSSLTLEKCEVLKGRRVILFPDLSKDGRAYRNWEEKVREFEKRLRGTQFVVSDLLEKDAADADRDKGLDLADYLIRLDWRSFRKQPTQDKTKPDPQPGNTPAESEACEKSEKRAGPEIIFFYDHPRVKGATEDWGAEIESLRSYFAQCSLPSKPFMLDQCTEIINPGQFIKAHLATLRTYNGRESGKPALQRLITLKHILTQNRN